MPFRVISRVGRKNKIETVEDLIPQEKFDILFSLIKKRGSVRKYSKKRVSDELILKILETARNAPSAGNHQPWEFIVVRNRDIKSDLVEAAYYQEWMLTAPVFIVACINMRLAGAVFGERGLKLYGSQDVAAAIENMLLAAEALGLGTCWVGSFSEVMVARILQCPDYVRPCAIITLGYPAEEPYRPLLQSLEEFSHLERFGETLQLEKVKKEKKPTYVKFQ